MSSTAVRFTRSCPTCGRRVEIHPSLLGASVACQHCNAQFLATVSDDERHRVDENHRLMARVDQLLEDTSPGGIA